MANRKDLQALLVVGGISVLVAVTGLWLGFHTKRLPAPYPPPPVVPEHGPILYAMRSVGSAPDRVRLEWREVPGATGYRVTLLTASDDSLFSSPALTTPSWTIPPDIRSRLEKQTVYHWRLVVTMAGGGRQVSEPASFATQ
jgi:hypothetical protein